MIGFSVSLSKLTAPMEQAGTHLRQPKHFSAFSSTPPPGRDSSAPAGHASMHAGVLQPRHTMAMKLLAIPPTVRILIALLMIE